MVRTAEEQKRVKRLVKLISLKEALHEVEIDQLWGEVEKHCAGLTDKEIEELVTGEGVKVE